MAEKNKKYFKISEVSQIVGVEPYVLRYWEKEFKEIRPYRFSSHRLYKSKDIEIVLEIKRLLYEEGFTVQGAKKTTDKTFKTTVCFKRNKERIKGYFNYFTEKTLTKGVSLCHKENAISHAKGGCQLWLRNLSRLSLVFYVTGVLMLGQI